MIYIVLSIILHIFFFKKCAKIQWKKKKYEAFMLIKKANILPYRNSIYSIFQVNTKNVHDYNFAKF